MKLKPQNDSVLCIRLNEPKRDTTEGGIFFKKEELPEYKIVASRLKVDSAFKEGDVIITNSIPTKLSADGTIYYIVKAEHIAGKIYDK